MKMMHEYNIKNAFKNKLKSHAILTCSHTERSTRLSTAKAKDI